MKLVLDQTSSKKRKRADKRLIRFEKLRNRLARKQKQVERFESVIDELVEVYRVRVLPMESEEKEPLARLTEKLTVFFGRKSLTERNRGELAEWILESLSTLQRFDSKLAAQLEESYLESVAAHMGLTVEEMNRLQKEEERRYEESMQEEFDPENNPFNDAASPQDDLFGFDDLNLDDDDQDSEGSDNPFQDDPFQYEAEATTGNDVSDQQLINGNWIRGLFRRTARALHPDRETDPGKHQEKHELMTRLLEARKQQDVMTILELFTEHVSGEALTVAGEDMDAICQLLENRIEDLDERQYDYLLDHPMRRMVYELLYEKSKKVREQKLKAWLKEIRTQIRETEQLVSELRNLTILRSHLKARRYSQAGFDEVGMIFDILATQTAPPFDVPF